MRIQPIISHKSGASLTPRVSTERILHWVLVGSDSKKVSQKKVYLGFPSARAAERFVKNLPTATDVTVMYADYWGPAEEGKFRLEHRSEPNTAFHVVKSEMNLVFQVYNYIFDRKVASPGFASTQESDTDSGNEAQQGEFDDSAAKETSARRDSDSERDGDYIFEVLSNDGEIYSRVTPSYIQNAARKIAKGVWDPKLGVKLWLYWVENAFAMEARKPHSEFKGKTLAQVTSPAARLRAAELAAEHYDEEVQAMAAKMKAAKDAGKPWFHAAGARLQPRVSSVSDPTKEELVAALEAQVGSGPDVQPDIEAAIYWYAYANHVGQASNLYSVLSTSPYRPGRNMRGPEDEGEMVAEMVRSLERDFG